MAAALSALAACGGGGDGAAADGGGANGGSTGSTGGTAPPSAPPPPPWGQLTLGGNSEVARTLRQFAPNAVPPGGGDARFRGAFWRMDSAWDARTTLEPPSPRLGGDVVLSSDNDASVGPFVGVATVVLRINTDPSGTPAASFRLDCGGAGASGLFADFRRDPQCDRINVDAASRSVRFSGLTMPGTDITLDGTLSYPDFMPDARSTATAASLAACPALPAAGPLLSPPAADAACLSGVYHGISDTNKPCSVTITSSAAGSTARVEVDGYTGTYDRLGSRDYNEREPDRSWEYSFTPASLGAIDPALATERLTMFFDDSPDLWGSAGETAGGATFLVTHSTAPAGVAGPYDVKFCTVPLR